MRKVHTIRFWWGFGLAAVLGIILVICLPLILAATGCISVSAQTSWGPIESLLDYASMRSITAHAPIQKNPFANDSDAVAVG